MAGNLWSSYQAAQVWDLSFYSKGNGELEPRMCQFLQRYLIHQTSSEKMNFHEPVKHSSNVLDISVWSLSYRSEIFPVVTHKNSLETSKKWKFSIKVTICIGSTNCFQRNNVPFICAYLLEIKIGEI